MKLAILTGLMCISLGLVTSVRAQSGPYAHTQAAGPINPTGATLNGMAVPSGAETTAWFEWGTNGNYGRTTMPVSVGNGFAVVPVSAVVSNLPPLSNFQCRLVVSNSLGVIPAAPVRFTTGQRVTQWGDTADGEMPIAAGLSNAVSISGGHFHSAALTADGRVVAWGNDTAGQSDVPAGLGRAIAISAGGYHNLVLMADGSVVAWGQNNLGQTNVPAGLSNVVAVAAGYDNSVALKADGTVVAWGDNSSGQATVPPGLSNVVAIAASGFHNVALKADGTVVAWGDNGSGQTNVPAGLSNVVMVAAGASSSFAIQADGTLVTWPVDTSVPASLGPIVAVDGGIGQTVVLQTDGMVVAWGINYAGITNVPVGLSNVVAVSAGGYHSLALGNLPPQASSQHLTGVCGQDLTVTLAGTDPNSDFLTFRVTALPATATLYQWTPDGRGTPISVPGTMIQDAGRRIIFAQPIASSDSFAFVANDGLVDSATATVQVDTIPARVFTHRPQPAGSASVTLCGKVLAAAPSEAWFEWGAFGGYGQVTEPLAVVGDGSLVYLTTPLTNLAALANFQCRLVVSNSFGVNYGMPVLFTTGRRVYGWGNTNVGGLNIPTTLTNAVFATGGWNNSAAIRADGTPVVWVGPSPPAGLTNVLDIAAGLIHCVALRSDGTVVAWGGNSNGQTSVPAGLSNVVDVSAGYLHSMALKADGTVAAWGEISGSGQATPPPGLSNVVAIGGGLFYDIALKVDGTVVAWGQDNGGGETIIPQGLMNVVSIAAGDAHCLALKSDGTVAAWGNNSSGQITVPIGLSNVVEVAARGNQSLALRADGTIVEWGTFSTANGNLVPGLTNVVLLAAGSIHGLALGNLVPQAQSMNTSGLVGGDLTVTLPAYDPDNDPLRYRITTLPSPGSLYQWTPAGRGALIATNNTWVNDPAGRIIYAQPLPISASFTFVANDSWAESTNATIRVTMSPAWAYTQPTRPAGPFATVLSGVAAVASPSTAWFEWGLAGVYGRTADMILAGDGSLSQITALVTNLTARVNHQCRLVVSNAFGVVYGAPMLFTTGRRVVGWGNNTYGQTTVPASLDNIVSAAGGLYHSLALKSDGTVVAWGFNADGETNVPAGLVNVIAVAGGFNHSLALKSDGTVTVWGSGSRGQTNVPPGLSNVIAISAGEYHSLALRSDGTVTNWGSYPADQLRPPVAQTNSPPGLSNVVSVASGSLHDLALKADGTVVAWGYNNYSQTNVPSGLSNVVAVAAGADFSLALRANGTIVGWGNLGQTAIPSSASNVVALAAGANQGLALRADGSVVAWGSPAATPITIPAGLSNVVAIAAGGYHDLALGNLPPQALGQTNVGLLGQDLTVILPAGDRDQDPLTYRIVSLPVAGTLYQWTSGGRGAAITTPNAAVTDSLGRVIFAPGSNLPGWPYTAFTFLANDGEADSAAATITVNLIPAPVIQVSGLVLATNGAFSFTFNGLTNASYRVWASTNFATWTLLGSASPSVPGLFSFSDLTATNWPMRYYRVSSP